MKVKPPMEQSPDITESTKREVKPQQTQLLQFTHGQEDLDREEN